MRSWIRTSTSLKKPLVLDIDYVTLFILLPKISVYFGILTGYARTYTVYVEELPTGQSGMEFILHS